MNAEQDTCNTEKKVLGENSRNLNLKIYDFPSRECMARLASHTADALFVVVQELCESRGGRPGLSVLTSILASVDVKIYWTMLRHWSQLVPNMSADIRGH